MRRILSVREGALEQVEALGRARLTFGAGVAAGLRTAVAEQEPGVRGVWRATIILPDGLSTQLSGAELGAVLLHELAHVRRHDNLYAAMAHLVVCVFWFYPLIWWLERRMLQEREAACDEMALARGAHAEEYLCALVKVCRMSFSAAAGYAGAGGSNFQARMERIMSTDLNRPSAPVWRACAAGVVAMAVLIPVSGAFLRAQQPAPEKQIIIATFGLTSAGEQIQAGLTMMLAGNFGGAEEAFRMALAFDHNNKEAIMGLAEALIAQGKTDHSVVIMKPEAAQSGGRAESHLTLGDAAVRAGKYDLALTEFQKALDALDPHSAAAGEVHFRIGELYRRMSKLEDAITQLRLAKNLLPGRSDVVFRLALCLESAERWQEAEKEYRVVIQIAPGNAMALNNLAYLLSQHGGDLDEALNLAQQAAQALPDLPEVSDTLGAVYLARGMTGAALEIFRKLLKQSPAQTEQMALRLADKGQRETVRAELTAALANHRSPADDEAIGRIMRKLK